MGAAPYRTFTAAAQRAAASPGGQPMSDPIAPRPTATGPAPAGPVLAGPAAITPERRDELQAAAQAFEAMFLAEMLKQGGAGQALEGGFGGGPGEAAFADRLGAIRAERMAAAGGIGLAEAVVKALIAREGGDVR
jgi:hypothetical protein